jgi:hypothetical protein
VAAARAHRKPRSWSLCGSGFAGTNTGRDDGSLDGRAAVKALRVPMLFNVARGDTESLRDARQPYTAARSHHERLMTVSVAAHSSFLVD